jgi:phosphate transport system substrate-binding protein
MSELKSNQPPKGVKTMPRAVLAVLLLSVGVMVPAVGNSALKGEIRVDGSSTVFPLSEAVAEEFGRTHGDVRVTVGTSGTGGGFKRFVMGETDINNASRAIKSDEVKKAQANKIQYVELPVAFDGITLVINPNNTWVDHLTVEEVKKIWGPDSKVKTWKDIRASWPAEKIMLYGPGPDSGTFDFFTEAINGKAQVSRSDYTKSEDDNVLVQGVAGDKNALGYFGYDYFYENQKKLKAVPIRQGSKSAVLPSSETIKSMAYAPLSRKVFIYVAKAAAQRPEVQAFVEFYLKQAPDLTKTVGFIPMPMADYQKAQSQFQKFTK